ncbi:MAG: class I SAM-dependent RNA methyltransferase, partial [Clostridia bacterium]|nr:class I SAM-dependent RNA methyltransferase [Clostridia bacterium]
MEKYKVIATATFGIEAIVGSEVKALGIEEVQVENSRVIYETDIEGIAKSNLWLRCADRVFLQIGEFKARSFEELFDKTYALPWEKFIPVNGEFPVNGKSVKSQLFSVSDCQAIVKKAVVKKLGETYSVEWFKEDGPKFPILVSILKDVVTLSIDTSGVGLHKRGYRAKGNEAPLKETLAAAMLNISRWHSKIP